MAAGRLTVAPSCHTFVALSIRAPTHSRAATTASIRFHRSTRVTPPAYAPSGPDQNNSRGYPHTPTWVHNKYRAHATTSVQLRGNHSCVTTTRDTEQRTLAAMPPKAP